MNKETLAALLDPAVQDFIRAHDGADVAALALKKPPIPGWPWREVLEQIKARQKAARKCPHWLEAPGFIFPAPDTVEQASSDATSRYKAALVKASTFIDLTGGSGADSAACAAYAASGTIIEKDPASAALLAHNMNLLHPGKLMVITGAAEDILPTLPETELVILDPQRREGAKRGIFRLEDGLPNVWELLPVLRKKPVVAIESRRPYSDDRPNQLETLPCVSQAHVLEVAGECKEILYLMDFETKTDTPPAITAAALDETGASLHRLSFTREEEEATPLITGVPEHYLFEPGPAFLKAGCFKLLAARYGLKKLAAHTHLYTGPAPCPDFPGRSFEILESLSAHKDTLKAAIPELKANLTVRNFPDKVENLRKKWGLKEGGEDYLFACTLADDTKIILRTRKF
ncbi:MAG: SAM-dependent methyltransferase [Alphaproteobacteria bacterium]|nr:SAM-dependent methyltransferase [Alphaproteobacteria bacterium]